MPGPGTTYLGGPLMAGTKLANPPAGNGDIGSVLLQQDVTLVHNGTNTVDQTLLLPGGAQIIDIIVDTTTAWNSATSDTLSVGLTSGGTDYAGSIDVKTAAGRQRTPFASGAATTGTQANNMLNVGTGSPQITIHATVTPVGSASAGQTTVSILYVMSVQLTLGTS